MRSKTVLWVALALSACKKPQPSPEYQQALVLHSKLYVEKLDDAYLMPQMAEVEALLEKVPSHSADNLAAAELLQKIRSERTRVEAANAAREKEVAEALAPTPFVFPERNAEPTRAAEAPAPAPDAGANQPVAGMTLSEFTRRFGGCFSAGREIEVMGMGTVDSYELKNIANCRDRHPGFDALLVLAQAGKLLGTAPKSNVRIELRYPDGGLVSPDAGR
ncbi:MAG: hypothetical protein ACOZIN_20955 [Myxococcota bacterium]